jgi:hypothetical protein
MMATATASRPQLSMAQLKALAWVVKFGTGASINVSRGRMLARLGLVEERGGPDSMLGRTAFVATETGRALVEGREEPEPNMDLLWLRTVLTDYRKRAIPVAERAVFDARCEDILVRLGADHREAA